MSDAAAASPASPPRSAGPPRVTANDIDPAALIIAGRNFAANNVTVGTVQPQSDERNKRCREADLIAGSRPVLPSIVFRGTSWSTCAARKESGSTVLIADSDRPFTPSTGVDPDCPGNRSRYRWSWKAWRTGK
jgi:predicted nicotinamide N-methyase